MLDFGTPSVFHKLLAPDHWYDGPNPVVAFMNADIPVSLDGRRVGAMLISVLVRADGSTELSSEPDDIRFEADSERDRTAMAAYVAQRLGTDPELVEDWKVDDFVEEQLDFRPFERQARRLTFAAILAKTKSLVDEKISRAVEPREWIEVLRAVAGP